MHPSLPDCQLEGYVYCLLFSDRTIKIGRTRHPDLRMSNYRYGGEPRAKELEIQQLWFSPRHFRYRENEREILGQVRRATGRVSDTEYFTWIDVMTVIEMMNGLDFSALDHQGRVSLMKDGRECPCRLCTDAFYEYETRAMYEWIDQGDREDYRKLV